MQFQKPKMLLQKAKTLLLTLTGMLLLNMVYASPKWVKQYQVPPATSSSALNAKVIETYDHGYVTVTQGTDPSSGHLFLILSKYDEGGTTVFEQKFFFGTIDLIPAAVAENPSDYSLAIVGTRMLSGVASQFLLKTDATGSYLWYQYWGTNEVAKSVLFSHDPMHTNDIIVAGSALSGTYAGLRLTEFNNSGTLINDAMYNMGPGNNLQTADMVEIVSTGQYCIAVNYTTGSVTIPAWVAINYTMASAIMDFYSYTSGLSGPNLVSMTKYEGGSTPQDRKSVV